MYKILNQKKAKLESESKLFSYYCQFFDLFVVEEFRRKYDVDKLYKGYRALILEIETYVQKVINYDKKADY